jgi:WD40 repeat protein
MFWYKKRLSTSRELQPEAERRQVYNRRIMVVAAMALLVVGISVFVGGYAYVQRQHAISRRQESEAQLQLAITRQQEMEQARMAEQEQRHAAEAQWSEARRQLYFSSILQARAQCDTGRYDLAQKALWQAPAEYANWEWGYLMGQCNQELAVLAGHKPVIAKVIFSLAGARIVTKSWDDTMRIWNATTGEMLKVFEGRENWGCPFSISPDDTRIAIAHEDNKARIWDLATLEPLVVLEGHQEYIRSVAFSRDGWYIVTASMDKTARVWDAASGEELMVLKGHQSEVQDAHFSPDGLRVATGSMDNTARIWDVATGEELGMRDTGIDGAFIEFSPDSSLLAIYGGGGCAEVCDAGTKDLASITQTQCECIVDVTFSPDGTRFFIVDFGTDAYTPSLWDTATRKQVAALDGVQEFIHSVAFSPDGSRFVTASEDTTARVWDTATGKELAVLEGHGDEVADAAFSPDGLRIVTASEDKTARIWDAGTGTAQWVFTGHSDALTSALFTPEGSRVITTSKDQTMRIWDAVPEPTPISKEGKEPVNTTSLSPDGARLVMISNSSARICDTATQKELLVLKTYEHEVKNAVFSQNGLQVVITSNNETACLLDAVPWRLEDLPKVAGEYTTPEEEREARFYEWKRLRYATWIQDHGIGLKEEEEVTPKTEEDKERVVRIKETIKQWDEKLDKDDENVLLFAQIAPAQETDTAQNTAASTKIVQVKDQESWPDYETTLTCYALLLRDDKTVAALNETPASFSGDWNNSYTHYFDEDGNTIAFVRYSAFFNGCVTPPDTPDDFIAKETSTYYFHNHKLIAKDYVLVDKDNNALAPTQCEFNYRHPYTIRNTWEESRAAAKISFTK